MQAAMRVLATFTLLGIVACTFDQKTIAVSASQVTVHAVLDPGAVVQDVLVEKTLTGSVSIATNVRFDPLDPINTGDGIPIARAEVSISGPDGTLVGRELRYAGKPSTYGAGRYVIDAGVGKTPIRPGARYTLTVRAPDGTVVTGTTLVPSATPLASCCRLDAFDRDRDTVRLDWRAVVGARTYGLRVESPFGPFLLFSDSTHLFLPGTLRNLFASDLQRLFIPGFQQQYTVFAVDTNYFDYYRSRNDPFTGSGIINRLQGGVGLLGSTVILDARTLDITQQPRESAFEGDYEITQTSRSLVDVMRLYVETPGASAAVSGWYSRDRKTSARDGIVGVRTGSRIELKFLLEQNARRHLATFTGTVLGDSLVGTYNGISGQVVFRRRAP